MPTSKPFVFWAENGNQWELMVQRNKKTYSVATVYLNGTWFTWAKDYTGLENSVEGTVRQAKLEAANSAIEQGLI